MPANVVSLSLALLVALACGVAIYFWRRASSLYHLLMEGAGRFEDLRQRSTQLEHALGKAEERLKQQRESAQKLEKDVDEARAKTSELTRQLEAKDQEKALSVHKLELIQGHLEKQLDKAEKRLAISEGQREQAEGDLATARGELAQARGQLLKLESEGEKAFESRLRHELELQRQDALLRERDLTVKLRESEREQAKIGRKLEEADPVETRRVKRKLVQYERLYQSMKGLREMTDERNRNWEVALRKLSAWILAKTGATANSSASIGAAVGQALAAIGEQLIDDGDFRTAAAAHRAGAHDEDFADAAPSRQDQDKADEAGGLSPAHAQPRRRAPGHGHPASQQAPQGSSSPSNRMQGAIDASLNDQELAAEQAALDREVEALLETPSEQFMPGLTQRSNTGNTETNAAAPGEGDKLKARPGDESQPRADG